MLELGCELPEQAGILYFMGEMFKRQILHKSTEIGEKDGGRRRKGEREGLKSHFLGKIDVYSLNWKKFLSSIFNHTLSR